MSGNRDDMMETESGREPRAETRKSYEQLLKENEEMKLKLREGKSKIALVTQKVFPRGMSNPNFMCVPCAVLAVGGWCKKGGIIF